MQNLHSQQTETAAVPPSEFASLYATPLPSTRSGPLYNAFSYPTKISPEAIAVFVATHTRPGARVLDTFGGSGTTGLAVLLCDRPTPEMVRMASALSATPVWGPREADIYELSTVGAFAARVLTTPPDPASFAQAAATLLEQAQERIGWLYETEDAEGRAGRIRHTIWSDVLACPHCHAEVSYWDAAVRWAPLRLERESQCRTCGRNSHIDDWLRTVETIPDPVVGAPITRKRRIPARVYGSSGTATWHRPAVASDGLANRRAEDVALPPLAPRREIVWGDLHRSGYHTGITHLHHFYTPRNFLAVATLWDIASAFPERLRDSLRLLVLSYNAAHSTLMTRVVVKSNQSDFVLTGAQSGVLYVSGLPVEKNVLAGVRRKIRVFEKAFASVRGSRSVVRVSNASSTTLALDSESIDYVFTDPPFGDFIPYAELNQINEHWLSDLTEQDQEIIVSGAQRKSVADYARMMTEVFREIARVLRPSGIATVVFHSAKASTWRALAQAYGAAGLRVQATSVLDKIQVSFKQVVSTVSVKGDPLLLLTKNAAPSVTALSHSGDVARDILSEAAQASDAERAPQRLFSRYVARCLEREVPVAIDAREFYERAKTHEV